MTKDEVAQRMRDLLQAWIACGEMNSERVIVAVQEYDQLADEPSAEVQCPCGTAYLRVDGGYVPVCDCAVKNAVAVNRGEKL